MISMKLKLIRLLNVLPEHCMSKYGVTPRGAVLERRSSLERLPIILDLL